MKFFGYIVVFSLLVNFSTQLQKFVNCSDDFLARNPSLANGCGMMTCHDDNSGSGVGCSSGQCAPGHQIAYIPSDDTKPYPECCGGPICS